MWLKFTEKDGKRVIDRASFQAFGCQTAMAVASMATGLLRGKTADEAASLSAAELSGALGPLPPMKIHCGQLVEGALKNALDATGRGGEGRESATEPHGSLATPLSHDLHRQSGGKLRIVPI
jgi:nitrogen fixation protein NifU and related proteins